MEWTKITIHTSEEAEEAACAILAEEGITGIQIEDGMPVSAEASGGLFGDVVPEFPPDDGSARISFYVDTDTDAEAFAAKITERLSALSDVFDVGNLTVTTSQTAEEDWINSWKQYFHSFFIDDIEIIPSWEEKAPDARAKMVLHMDPGTAFGTGAHASTQLAIRALRKELHPGMNVLDIGTGSGILGIVALKEGASCVFGTDLDENVLPAVADNLKKNDIDASRFVCALGDITTDESLFDEAMRFVCDKDTIPPAYSIRANSERSELSKGCVSRREGVCDTAGYDIVIANIIAEILAGITPSVPRFLKPGGVFILSGILQTHADVIKTALAENGFMITEEQFQDEWESITAVCDGKKG